MIKLGNEKIAELRLGAQEIKKAYLGGALVFDAVPAPVKPPRLPAGYTEVEYIYSGDNQCTFSKNITFNNATDAIAVDIKLDYFVSGYEYIFLAGTTTSKQVYINRTNETNLRMKQYSSLPITDVKKYLTGKRTIIEYDGPGKKFLIDGSSYSVSTSNTDQSTALKLFGCNIQSSNSSPKEYIYGATYKKNGVLISEFVPCINPSGVIGLYDIIQGEFLSNAKSGVLTAGPAV